MGQDRINGIRKFDCLEKTTKVLFLTSEKRMEKASHKIQNKIAKALKGGERS